MRLQFTLTGVSPILMHNGPAGIDTRNPLSREIAAIAEKGYRHHSCCDTR